MEKLGGERQREIPGVMMWVLLVVNAFLDRSHASSTTSTSSSQEEISRRVKLSLTETMLAFAQESEIGKLEEVLKVWGGVQAWLGGAVVAGDGEDDVGEEEEEL